MFRELELHFGGRDGYFTVEQVEVSCGTELMNYADRRRKQESADMVSFGPVCERDEHGIPLYGKVR